MTPTLLPELILHLTHFLSPSDTFTLVSLSQLSLSHRTLLLPRLFSHLSLTPSPTLPARIHALSDLTFSRPDLCSLVRTASIDLGSGRDLAYGDLVALSRLLSRLPRLRKLSIVESWDDVSRMAGRGRLYGCWIEAALPTGDGWGQEMEEVELVGVTGDEARVQRFVGGLGGKEGLRRKKVALVRLVRVKGTPFSTGQLAVGFELGGIATRTTELEATEGSAAILSPLGGRRHESTVACDFEDPTASLEGFLRSLAGSQTREIRLALPFGGGVDALTVEWVHELTEALRRYAPKTRTVEVTSSGPQELCMSPEAEQALQALRQRLPFPDMGSPL